MDKTGTLTHGKPKVVEMKAFDGVDEKKVLYWAAIAEKRSEHPLARAVTEKAESLGLSIPHPESFENFRGRGVKARWDSKTIMAGSSELLNSEGLAIPESAKEWLKLKESEGQTPLLITLDHQLVGVISIADTLREKAKVAIQKIRSNREN